MDDITDAVVFDLQMLTQISLKQIFSIIVLRAKTDLQIFSHILNRAKYRNAILAVK
jgi:hypothetical protein